MKLENILIEEDALVKDAIKQLEQYRCKFLYVVEKKKLKASISDGDIRRFLINKSDINQKVTELANYSPRFIYESDIKNVKESLRKYNLVSLPVINANGEIVSVVFANDTNITSKEEISLPVVIVAGGLGTRLYPYTKILPKALIPIGDIPITEHIINKFKACGCNDFYMILNHKKNMVKSYYDYISKDYKLEYIEEEIPLGTGGGLSLLKGKINCDFFLSNCDILIDANYIEVYKYHKQANNLITIIAAQKHSCIPYGVLKTNNENLYEGIEEKPKLVFTINTGCYIVSEMVIEDISINYNIGFPDIIEHYHKLGEKIGVYFISEDAFMDMGQLEELEEMKIKLEL